MNWYEKLNAYFPIEEMKSKEHMDTLLKEKSDVYYKDESADHVLMYAEFNSFIFVDYVWVSAAARGQGIGHQLIEKLKQKNKSILLEVEPVDSDDSDTKKRLYFYKREGFQHAQAIDYCPSSRNTNETSTLEILYWSKDEADDRAIYKQMKKMYEDIHTYKDTEIYGEPYKQVDEVLHYDLERDEIDILEIVR